MKLLGALITIPMIIINIVTGVFAITFALAQLVFFPVRGLSAAIQDFLGPSSLEAHVSATCCPFGENIFDSNISLYQLPCRVRQFKVAPEEKSIQTQSEDDAHLTKHLLPS
jgi:hypothetical protein